MQLRWFRILIRVLLCLVLKSPHEQRWVRCWAYMKVFYITIAPKFEYERALSNPSNFIDWKVSAADPILSSRQYLEIQRQYTLDPPHLFYARPANPNGQAYPAPHRSTQTHTAIQWFPMGTCSQLLQISTRTSEPLAPNTSYMLIPLALYRCSSSSLVHIAKDK